MVGHDLVYTSEDFRRRNSQQRQSFIMLPPFA